MDYLAVIRSQYLASLAMLQQAIEKCPEPLWDNPTDKTRFWHIAYHVLFYTHLYLQPARQDFKAWSKHRPDYESLRLHTRPKITAPYSREDVLEYLAFCQQQVEELVPCLNLEARSGFDWLPFSKLELQIYNIRHIQQHAGELMERLGSRAGVDVDWVGSKPAEAK